MPKFYITSKHTDARWLIERLNIKEALNRYEFLEAQKLGSDDICQYDSVMVSESGFGKKELGEFNVQLHP